MRLGCEVDGGVAARPGTRDRVRIGDVANDELDSEPLEICRIARVGQLVEDDRLGSRSEGAAGRAVTGSSVAIAFSG